MTTAQVREAVAAGVEELEDLRRRLRVGFGPCQGAFRVWRAAGVLCEERGDAEPAGDPLTGLARFLGDQARQLLLNQAIYRGIFALEPDGRVDEAVELATSDVAPAGAGVA